MKVLLGLTNFDMNLAKKVVKQQLERAQCNISGHAVGACLVAKNNEGSIGYYGGCNIELSTSRVFHAETVALTNAISDGYRKFIGIVVSSKSRKQKAALCGYCRQDYMYADPNIPIYILEPNGDIKLYVEHVIDTLKYPYMGKGKLNK